MAIEMNEGESFFEEHGNATPVFEKKKLSRIDFLDKRVYKVGDTDIYYPSVTNVLSYLPANKFFLEWLTDVGHNADIIRNKASREGTQVHEAIEKLIKGEDIEWQDGYGNAKYSLQVWQMILKAADFFNTYKPETMASELFIWSDKYKYAGATDWLGKFWGYTWLLDFKTSNQLSKGYDLQLAAYKKAVEERMGIHVDKCGILWLKASTRGPRKGAIQGSGWQLKEVENPEKDFEAFRHVYAIYELFNPECKPYTVSYPTQVCLDYL